MRIEKGAVFFEKNFNLMFLLCFSVIRSNFGVFLVLFNGGVLLFWFPAHCSVTIKTCLKQSIRVQSKPDFDVCFD